MDEHNDVAWGRSFAARPTPTNPLGLSEVEMASRFAGGDLGAMAGADTMQDRLHQAVYGPTARADDRQVGGQHYKDMPMQPWDVMQAVMSREEFIGFLKGNIIKYSMRAGQKAGAGDDGEKARHYRQKLLELSK
jgi:hypothetical protein